MRVLENTPDRLVIEDRPVALAIVCLGLFFLFLVLGLGMAPILAALTGLPPATIPDGVFGPGLLAYASAIPLLVALFAVKTRRLTFDRSADRVTLARRGAFGSGQDVYPLAAFQAAVLRRSMQQTSRTAWAELMFAGRENVRVTPYGTGGNGPARMVDAINDWHGRTGLGLSFEGPAVRFVTPGGAEITIRRS